jgi:hypothetical protein
MAWYLMRSGVRGCIERVGTALLRLCPPYGLLHLAGIIPDIDGNHAAGPDGAAHLRHRLGLIGNEIEL